MFTNFRVLYCIREEHPHDSLNRMLTAPNFHYSVRSVDRQESTVPFGNTKTFNHSLAKRVPELYKKWM